MNAVMSSGRAADAGPRLFHSGWRCWRPKPDSNRRVPFCGRALTTRANDRAPRLGSNQRPPGSEPGALSAELRGRGARRWRRAQVGPKATASQAVGRAAVHDAGGWPESNRRPLRHDVALYH
jgi:hypothetical protein